MSDKVSLAVPTTRFERKSETTLGFVFCIHHDVDGESDGWIAFSPAVYEDYDGGMAVVEGSSKEQVLLELAGYIQEAAATSNLDGTPGRFTLESIVEIPYFGG